MKTFDISAVKAFVLAAELQSFTQAAHALGTTQSAVSLKLRRLEEQVGRRLLERSPRHVRLSAEGQVFLVAARELVATHDRAAAAFDAEQRRLAVGISHEFLGGALPSLFRRIGDQDPNLRLEVRVAGTHDLMHAYEQGELDAALVLRPEDRRKQGKAVYSQSFSWFASAGWAPCQRRPVPLATQGKLCRVRNAATRALDDAGIAWEEVFIGKGAALVGAAAAAGLAVAVMAKHVAPLGVVDVSNDLSLPPIPPQEVMLYSTLNDRRSRETLRTITVAFQQAR